jgi:Ulp1 family protease
MQLFIPINLDEQHWIVACVDLLRRHISLYDSYIANESTEKVLQRTECLPVILPRLMRIGGRSSGSYDLSPFTIERILEDVPQQPLGSGTCGIFMSRFVEYIGFGVPLTTLDGLSVSDLRERFALDCYCSRHLVKKDAA